MPNLQPDTKERPIIVFTKTFRRRPVKGYKKCQLVKMVAGACEERYKSGVFHEAGGLVPYGCTWRTVCTRYTNRWPAEKKTVECQSSSSPITQSRSFVCGSGRVAGRCRRNTETIKVLRLALCRRRLKNGRFSRGGRLEMIEVKEKVARSCSCVQ